MEAHAKPVIVDALIHISMLIQKYLLCFKNWMIESRNSGLVNFETSLCCDGFLSSSSPPQANQD